MKVAALADLPPGASLAARVDGVPVALFNVAGTVYAIHNVCPHAGAPLDRGARTGSCGEIVICPFHGWRFDVRTGRSPHLPGEVIRTYPTRVTDGEIEVSVAGEGS